LSVSRWFPKSKSALAASSQPASQNRASSISVSKYKIKMQPEDVGW